MFTMKSPISRSAIVDLDDQTNIKFALTALGYHDDSKEGLSPYSSEGMFDAIKHYQKANNLKVDGIINPDGETHTSLRMALNEDDRTGSAFGDFWKNYQDMRTANTRNADKYFHCKANYEASSRGWAGNAAAQAISIGREMYGTLKGDTVEDSAQDINANSHGQNSAKSGKYKNANEACAIYRPEGLSDDY